MYLLIFNKYVKLIILYTKLEKKIIRLALKLNENGSSGTKTPYLIHFVDMFIDFGYRNIVDIKLTEIVQKRDPAYQC